MPPLDRPAWIEIDPSAISQNVSSIQTFVGPQTDILAVVKANAYGHGLDVASKAALRGGAKALGVALPQEGEALRNAGIEEPILVLGPTLESYAPMMVKNALSSVVTCRSRLRALSLAAKDLRTQARIHLKIDTGMGRVGCSPTEGFRLLAEIEQDEYLFLEGIMSHIAWEKPADHGKVLAQIRQFSSFVEKCAPDPARWLHIANSATTLQFPQSHLNLVRVGLLTYGLPPVATPLALRPALSLKAQITQVRLLPAGQTLSYGGTRTLTKPSRIALIPLGYADGYSRRLSNRAHVLVHGTRCPVVGNICMDLLLIDVTPLSAVSVGDVATLIGRDGPDQITPLDLAGWSDSIVHEIISQLSTRLPREYIP